MTQLWTDIIDPATLTGYARRALAEADQNQATLAAWLPNRTVNDTIVRYVQGDNGFVEEAEYRAYDAEPTIGAGPRGKRVAIELPAIGRIEPITEYNQLRGRNATDETLQGFLLGATRRVVRAVADTTERMRAQVLLTGKATIDQENYVSDDDFGRDSELTITVATVWSDPEADPITDLMVWAELYEDKNGVEPGALVGSRRILTTLANSRQFRVNLVGGGSRPASVDDVNGILAANGLPAFQVYSRRTAAGRVLPEDQLLMLPAAGDPNSEDGGALGATVWGETLTATDPNYEIAEIDRPGIVVGTYRNPKPPMIAEVISDAISLPVLANANLSLAAKVL